MNAAHEAYRQNLKSLIADKRWYGEMVARGSYCTTCGRQEDPRLIEMHHVGGRRNSPLTIPVCPRCHKILTLKQCSWPESWTAKNNPPLVQTVMMLLGLKAIVEMVRKDIHEILSEPDEVNDGEY